MIPAWVKGTLVLSLALAAGVAIGVTYERYRVSSRDASHTNAHHVVDRLERDLDLDPEQRKAIAAILARRQGAVDSTWRVMQPHVHATLDSALGEIMAVLRPDQLAKYRRLVGSQHPEAIRMQ